VIFLKLVNENMKITELLWLAIDICLFTYAIIVLNQILYFTLVFIYQFTYVSRLILQDSRTQFRLSFVKSTVPLARHTRRYFRNHHRMTRLILQLDHGLISQMIFTIIICQSF